MNYVKHFWKALSVSVAIMIVGLVMAIVFGGLNMGIDFTGGTILTLDLKQDFDSDVISAAMAANGISNTPVVKSGSNPQQQYYAVVRMRTLDDDVAENNLRQAILAEVRKTYPDATSTVDRVGAVASAELVRNAFFSVLIASVLMLIYIWFRFEWMYGISAVLALMHDVALMIAAMAILRIEINSSFIAAVLTIVGYSINNTIVVFDRIRENVHRTSRRGKDREQLVNTSIQETLLRSINTSVTTLLTITCVYILGVASIKEFSLPIIIGLIGGTYSSIFLAAPMWLKLHLKLDKKSNAKKT